MAFHLMTCQSEEYIGQVLIKNPELLILRGEEWSGQVNIEHLASFSCDEGDIVRITGETVNFGWLRSNCIKASDIKVIGHTMLPKTEDVPGGKIAGGELLYHFVRTSGIVTSVTRGSPGWNWMLLKSDTGNVGITIRESNYSYEALRNMIDATITIRGIVVRSWGNEQYLGAHISLRGENAINILAPPPNDPFAVPVFTHIEYHHRQQLTGTMVASGTRRAMIRLQNGTIILAIPSEDTTIPSVGRKVTISGFAETTPINLRFCETIFRDDGIGECHSDPIQEPDLTNLFNGHYHGEMLAIEGVVTAIILSHGAHALTLKVCDHEILADISALRDDLREVPPAGSRIRLVGVCNIEYENSSPSDAFPRLRQVVIIPRAANDIAIVNRPPWWTPTKFGICLLVLVSLACLRELFNRSASRVKLRERTSLAIELHDYLAQFLTGVSLQLDAAEMAEANAQPFKAKKHIANARKALKSCRENLRYCLGDLRRRAFSEARFDEAIRQSVLPHIGSAQLFIRFNIFRGRFPDTVVHVIICIIRELAVNSVRHGKAKRIFIAGEHKNGQIRFSVRDDGNGFDPAACPGSSDGHFGLLGVRERLHDFQGSIQIDSTLGRGTKVTITLTP